MSESTPVPDLKTFLEKNRQPKLQQAYNDSVDPGTAPTGTKSNDYRVISEEAADVESKKLYFCEWAALQPQPKESDVREKRLAIKLNNKTSKIADTADLAGKKLFRKDMLQHFLPGLLADVDDCANNIMANVSAIP